jgi:hypothetical protein
MRTRITTATTVSRRFDPRLKFEASDWMTCVFKTVVKMSTNTTLRLGLKRVSGSDLKRNRATPAKRKVVRQLGETSKGGHPAVIPMPFTVPIG